MRRLIRVDGSIEEFAEPIRKWDAIEKLIGANTVGVVRLRHLGEPEHVMLVDDNGYESKCVETPEAIVLVPVKARKPVNPEATKLYHANCVPGTTHQIVGDVLVVPDEDFAEAGEV